MTAGPRVRNSRGPLPRLRRVPGLEAAVAASQNRGSIKSHVQNDKFLAKRGLISGQIDGVEAQNAQLVNFLAKYCADGG